MSDASPHSDGTTQPATNAGQETQTAPPDETKAAEPPPGPNMAAKFKLIMDKEREVLQKHEALKAKEREVAEAEQLKALAKANPAAFMASLGITEKDLGAHAPDPQEGIKKELSELRSALQEYRRQEEERMQRLAVEEARASVRTWVQQTSEFPSIKALGAEDLVYQKISDTYARTGKAISEVEAARDVEKELASMYQKLSSVLGTKSNVQTSNAPPSQPTLTNQHASQPPRTVDPDKLSLAEATMEAARLLQWSRD